MKMDLETSPEANVPTSSVNHEQRLNLALRLAASQASSLIGGGASLLFTTDSPNGLGAPQLRAAAGYLKR